MAVKVLAKYVPHFKPGEELLERVNSKWTAEVFSESFLFVCVFLYQS